MSNKPRAKAKAPMRRGAVSKANATLIGCHFPDIELPAIREAVRRMDTDTSKFLRQAVREKLARIGMG